MALTDEQIRFEWDKADLDGSGSLSLSEIGKLLGKINLKLKGKEVKRIFKETDSDGNGELNFEEFKLFFERLRVRPEIQQIFEGYFFIETDEEDEISWTAEQFLEFLKKTQKDSKADLQKAQEIIEFYEGSSNNKLYVTGFCAYLASLEHNSMCNPEHNTRYQPLDQPFQNYYINSSHNTYLLGDQLKGESSVEAYITALKKGCRCVEVDCWDGKDGEIIVYHGHTLTSKILFRDVVIAIRDYGFVASDLPVIVSLEIHCNLDGQRTMSEIFLEILGAAGMLPPLPDVEGVCPPPEQLKRKVLLKGKRVATKPIDMIDCDVDDIPDNNEPEISISNYSEILGASRAEMPPPFKTQMKQSTPPRFTPVPRALPPPKEWSKKGAKSRTVDFTPGSPPPKVEKNDKKKQPAKVSPELSEIMFFKAVRFRGWEVSKEIGTLWEMSSYNELKTEKFMTKSTKQFLEHNTRQLTRTYPKGLRVDSSNYDPIPCWNSGCHLVALNYQTGSEPMWYNDAKFRDNGNCGYVLKPKFLLGDDIKYNPLEPLRPKTLLTVNIISGWQLPKEAGNEHQQKGDVIDPYVKLSLAGIPSDMRSQRTKTVKNNGFNPVWKAEFQFPIAVPELAILLFVISDESVVSSDDFIGQFGIPVNSIREGYRCVPLADKKGNLYAKASLLVHFKMEPMGDEPVSAISPNKLLRSSQSSNSPAPSPSTSSSAYPQRASPPQSSPDGSPPLQRRAFTVPKQPPKYEGYLHKQSNTGFKMWSKKYFSLENGEMRVFKSTDTSKMAQDTFRVTNMECALMPASRKVSNGFQIQTPERVWNLRAENEGDLDLWKARLLSNGAIWKGDSTDGSMSPTTTRRMRPTSFFV